MGIERERAEAKEQRWSRDEAEAVRWLVGRCWKAGEQTLFFSSWNIARNSNERLSTQARRILKDRKHNRSTRRVLTPTCPPVRTLDVPACLFGRLRRHEAQRPPLLDLRSRAHPRHHLLVHDLTSRPSVPPHEIHKDLLPGAGRPACASLLARWDTRHANVLDLLHADATSRVSGHLER